VIEISLEETVKDSSPARLSTAKSSNFDNTSTFNSGDSPPSPSSSPKRRKSDANHTTGTSLANDSRVHVFDPFFSGDEYGKAANSKSTTSSLSQERSGPVIDIADKLQSHRPFPYLFRLCSTQPNFLANPVSTGPQDQKLGDILRKHDAHIDWEEMDAR